MIPPRDVDESYFLEASAGTGKTTQLIGHIVRCVGDLHACGGGRNETPPA